MSEKGTQGPSRRAVLAAAMAAPLLTLGTAEAAPVRKKGVATWHMPGIRAALDDVGAGWFHNWDSTKGDIDPPPGVEFVPTIWGRDHVTPERLRQAAAQGTHLLGFNEPDLPQQANMTVDQALDLWPRLASTGNRMGAPAVASGADREGGWLDRFLAGARARNLRVDFIPLHWYGADFGPAAVGQLRGYLKSVHDKHRKPLWVTEFALIDFSGPVPRYPTQRQLATFARDAAEMMHGLPFVERYAWFALPADRGGTGLYRGATPNEVGRAYRSVERTAG
ncbi:glycoside hydrolase family protein [Lentzea sp. NPDC005914]|uniref:glycoside hydrolase family protein n=1 Tax=Lentzea sp. NPDC005914 TaxID=3154572 RepID=UPI0033F1BC33